MKPFNLKFFPVALLSMLFITSPALSLTPLSEVDVKPKRTTTPSKPKIAPKNIVKPKPKVSVKAKIKPKPKAASTLKPKPSVKPRPKARVLSKEERLIKSLQRKMKLQDAHVFKEGRAVIKVNNKCGYIDTTGDILIPLDYIQCEDFNEGFAMVQSATTKKCGFIDKTNRALTEFAYKCYGEEFKNGYAFVSRDDDKTALINNKGEFIIPFIYFAYAYNTGKTELRNSLIEHNIAIYRHLDQVELDASGRKSYSGEYKIIDAKGESVFDFDADNYFVGTQQFGDGLLAVRKKHKEAGIYPVGIMDDNGKVTKTSFYRIGKFSNGIARFEGRGSNKYGLINKLGKIIVKPSYDSITIDDSGYVVVTMDNKVGLMDTSGKVIIEPKFDAIWGFHEGLAKVVLNGGPWLNGDYGVVDVNNGQYVIQPSFKDVQIMDDYIKVETKSGLYGYYDHQGKEVIKPEFEYIGGYQGDTTQKLIPAVKHKKYGFIDTNGKTVIPFLYDNAKAFKEGLAPVEINDKYGFIDKQGKPLEINGI